MWRRRILNCVKIVMHTNINDGVCVCGCVQKKAYTVLINTVMF